MYFKTSAVVIGTLAVASYALDQAASYESNDVIGLLKRQTRVCKPVPPPVTCERSCGSGFIQCVLPNMCYNPGLGDTCCANGKYCPKGTYCTDKGCCPEGQSLEQCGASRTISVIPPPAATTAAPSETEDDDDEVSTTQPTKPTSKPIIPTGIPSVLPTGTGRPGNPGSPSSPGSPGTNATVTSPNPPKQTVNGASQLQGVALALGIGAAGVLAAFF